MLDNITIAVSKGRIFDEALPLLAKLNIVPKENPNVSRKLVLETNHSHIKLLIIRATDVPTYVERGAAEIGIAGKDVLMEYAGEGVYEAVNLKIAKCNMVLAGLKEAELIEERPRVATKYTNITRNYFADKGRQVEIIKLYGSMELAPVLGLSDWIVDLVDTGNTLKANGLVTIEHIADISSYLIFNKAAMKMKNKIIKSLFSQLVEVVGEQND